MSHENECENMWIPVSEALKIVLKWGSTKLDADALARIVYREDDILIARENQVQAVYNLLDIVGRCVPNGIFSKPSKLWNSLNSDATTEKNSHTALVDAHGAADV